VEESPQIDVADGSSGGIKAVAQSDLAADLFDHSSRNVKDLRLALDEDGELKLHMQVLAVGTTTVRAATSSLAFDEGAGEHFAERCEAADESSSNSEIRVAGHLTLIIVSETNPVNTFLGSST
jgi:hypothetical protein